MKKYKWVILVVFIIAVLFRFYAFRESIYFAFDQARDGYISRDIFLKKDLKLIGPPISGNLGLYHGVLFWYLLGMINILGKGDPIVVSIFFRIINILGILLVWLIGKNIFNKKTALLAVLFYAVSFEQIQYSIYVGNPTLAGLTILLIFLGGSWLLRDDKVKNNWAPVLMFSGAALATQLNLIYGYTFATVLVILILFKERSFKINIKYYVVSFLMVLGILSTYILSEFKYNFRNFKTAINLIWHGYGILNPNQSKYELFGEKYLTMFKDNLLGLIDNKILLILIALLITLCLIKRSQHNQKYRLLLIWISSWIFLMMFGGHLAYYTNAGLSVGLILFVSSWLAHLISKRKILGWLLVVLIILGNVKLIIKQNHKSLTKEFASQTMMRLSDEYALIDEMYKEAKGNGFTIQVTGIPYNVQTIWAYLFEFYGYKKYGYFPYWQNGNVLGFPGKLPNPYEGTTCVRFKIIEPVRGIPTSLIKEDEETENGLSIELNKKKFGEFVLETRKSVDKNCHNNFPKNI